MSQFQHPRVNQGRAVENSRNGLEQFSGGNVVGETDAITVDGFIASTEGNLDSLSRSNVFSQFIGDEVVISGRQRSIEDDLG